MAIAGFVLGIISAIFSLIFTPIGFICGVLGIIFSSLRLSSNLAKWGLGLSIAGTTISVLWAAVMIVIYYEL